MWGNANVWLALHDFQRGQIVLPFTLHDKFSRVRSSTVVMWFTLHGWAATGAHTLQDFWPGGIPEESAWSLFWPSRHIRRLIHQRFLCRSSAKFSSIAGVQVVGGTFVLMLKVCNMTKSSPASTPLAACRALSLAVDLPRSCRCIPDILHAGYLGSVEAHLRASCLWAVYTYNSSAILRAPSHCQFASDLGSCLLLETWKSGLKSYSVHKARYLKSGVR